MNRHCMTCGRPIELEEYKPDPYEDEDDLPPKKTVIFCKICEAKIRSDSDKNKKEPKPM